jgi:hypothetical protein
MSKKAGGKKVFQQHRTPRPHNNLFAYLYCMRQTHIWQYFVKFSPLTEVNGLKK